MVLLDSYIGSKLIGVFVRFLRAYVLFTSIVCLVTLDEQVPSYKRVDLGMNFHPVAMDRSNGISV
jgi:hypothetical protein